MFIRDSTTLSLRPLQIGPKDAEYALEKLDSALDQLTFRKVSSNV